VEGLKNPKNAPYVLAALTAAGLIDELVLMSVKRGMHPPSHFQQMYVDVLLRFTETAYEKSEILCKTTKKAVLKLYEDMKRDGILQ